MLEILTQRCVESRDCVSQSKEEMINSAERCIMSECGARKACVVVRRSDGARKAVEVVAFFRRGGLRRIIFPERDYVICAPVNSIPCPSDTRVPMTSAGCCNNSLITDRCELIHTMIVVHFQIQLCGWLHTCTIDLNFLLAPFTGLRLP